MGEGKIMEDFRTNLKPIGRGQVLINAIVTRICEIFFMN